MRGTIDKKCVVDFSGLQAGLAPSTVEGSNFPAIEVGCPVEPLINLANFIKATKLAEAIFPSLPALRIYPLPAEESFQVPIAGVIHPHGAAQ